MDRNIKPLGKIEIAPEVLEIIAGLAASKVKGVSSMKGGVAGFNPFLGRKNHRQGIQVNIQDDRTVVEVSIIAEYGHHIPDVAIQVQEEVKTAIESMTGIIVDQVKVLVEGIRIPQMEKNKGDHVVEQRVK